MEIGRLRAPNSCHMPTVCRWNAFDQKKVEWRTSSSIYGLKSNRFSFVLFFTNIQDPAPRTAYSTIPAPSREQEAQFRTKLGECSGVLKRDVNSKKMGRNIGLGPSYKVVESSYSNIMLISVSWESHAEKPVWSGGSYLMSTTTSASPHLLVKLGELIPNS